jgi:hypothetical protein
MVALDTQVRIVPSETLIEMRLIGLVGRGGRVIEQIISGDDKLHGYMVCLDKLFMGECLWFVPANAVQPDE